MNYKKGFIFSLCNLDKLNNCKSIVDRNVIKDIQNMKVDYLFCLRKIDDNYYLCAYVYCKEHRNSIKIYDKYQKEYWVSFFYFVSVNSNFLVCKPIIVQDSYLKVQSIYDEHNKILSLIKKEWKKRKKRKIIKERQRLISTVPSSYNEIIVDDDYNIRYESRMKWSIAHPYQGGRMK